MSIDEILREPSPLSVTELTECITALLEDCLQDILVEGEVSNFKCHSSGHWYFVLKDERTQVKCASFRNSNIYIKFKPQDGEKILARGSISVYKQRGEYQLIVYSIEPTGKGQQQLALEELTRKLKEEGLFAEDRKRPLKRIPARIAIITSKSGAVLQDILRILARRNPAVEVFIYPVHVQGCEAVREIVEAFEVLNERNDIDTIIVARGGGSQEDLQAFNHESVVRAVASSKAPVISAIGHETDYTLTDYAADCRAPTPSAAAELVAVDIAELHAELERSLSSLQLQMQCLLLRQRYKLEKLISALRAEKMLKITGEYSQTLDDLSYRLRSSMQARLEEFRAKFSKTASKLESLSPLEVLSRGYAIATSSDGNILCRAEDASLGMVIEIRLRQGSLICRVEKILSD
ncbi:MAG: exodeoxyribonuclease VII large subunit [Acidobacteriota bacterium]|nr:exodeoxyribonuclease VII large subunit [Blastocatellia bacterium]MDW8412190.1 exodeoxyribonuclease VII large subunit [Acidobacteriota bacterium]